MPSGEQIPLYSSAGCSREPLTPILRGCIQAVFKQYLISVSLFHLSTV